MKRLIIAVAALAAILAGSSAISGSDIDILVKGNHSAIKSMTMKDFHNQADLDAFMATAFDKGHAPSLSAVDWTKQMVLVLFVGQQKYSGYQLRFTKVDDSGDAVQVSTKVVIPCSTHARVEDQQPFLMVAVPASTKPVNFTEPEQDYQKC